MDGKISGIRPNGQDQRTINNFDHHYLHSAGVATPAPGEAPPMAGFIIRYPWLQNARSFQSSPNGCGRGLGREKYVKGEEKFLRPAGLSS